MNTGPGRGNLPAMISLVAAIAILVSMVLPWVQQGSLAPSYSYLDVMSGKTVIQVGWLTAGLLVVGALLAAGAAGSSLLTAAPGTGAAKIAVAGFTAALGGFGLWFVLWGKVDQMYGWAGVQIGIGVLAGVAAALVGLLASIADLRSMPAPGVISAPAGGWSASPDAAQPQAAFGRPGIAPTQARSSAGGRISYVDAGRPNSIVVNAGQQVMIGRGAAAGVRLSDPKVSREHAIITFSGGSWLVRDLGATNATRLLDASGSAQTVNGEIRIASGQLLIGEGLVTLFPAGS
jgi:hypothetical protein